LPTYEYRCAAGHHYEKREGFDAPPKQKCTRCRRQASRLISAPPIVFKGSGFYKTDNRGSDSESAPSTTSSTPTASTPAADAGHGHAHGPDGHTHGASTSTDAVETAAAG
jgi:putative FmdB family regulatory protein